MSFCLPLTEFAKDTWAVYIINLACVISGQARFRFNDAANLDIA
jgi:hypothetical protein